MSKIVKSLNFHHTCKLASQSDSVSWMLIKNFNPENQDHDYIYSPFPKSHENIQTRLSDSCMWKRLCDRKIIWTLGKLSFVINNKLPYSNLQLHQQTPSLFSKYLSNSAWYFRRKHFLYFSKTVGLKIVFKKRWSLSMLARCAEIWEPPKIELAQKRKGASIQYKLLKKIASYKNHS